jgi:hypothetical protein
MKVFFTSTNGGQSSNVFADCALFTAGFTDVVIPVPAAAGTFDPTIVGLIRTEFETPPGSPGPWRTPSSLFYIDSITSQNGNLNDTFNTNPVAALFGHSGARNPMGIQSPQVVWFNLFPP